MDFNSCKDTSLYIYKKCILCPDFSTIKLHENNLIFLILRHLQKTYWFLQSFSQPTACESCSNFYLPQTKMIISSASSIPPEFPSSPFSLYGSLSYEGLNYNMLPVLFSLMCFAKLSCFISQASFRSQTTPKMSICCSAAERFCYKGRIFRHCSFLDILLKTFLLLFVTKPLKVATNARGKY